MPRASSLEADIKKQHANAEIELVRGRGGVFDVVVDGDLVFSKHEAGRFPEPAEVLEALSSRVA